MENIHKTENLNEKKEMDIKYKIHKTQDLRSDCEIHCVLQYQHSKIH